jgi:hypothetical protein
MKIGPEWSRIVTRLLLAPACALLLLSASCEGVRKVVTLTFTEDDPGFVTISTQTDLGSPEEGTPEAAAADREREALLSGSDDWALRFSSAEPESERVTFQRERKQLQRVERIGRVPIGNLQRFFFDTSLTVTVTRGEGWDELAIYAGAGTRATRQQKERVEKLLANFSRHAVRYFAATRAVYDYLRDNRPRAEPLFLHLGYALASNEENTPPLPPLNDVEEALVATLGESIEALLDGQQGAAGDVDREFDAAFNPLPGELHVFVPGEPLAVEGFERMREGGLVVKPVSVLEAVAALEGRWVSPDPLAVLLRAGDGAEAPRIFAESLAAEERRTDAVVGAEEVSRALVEAMKPAPRFRVRWIRRGE